MSCCTCCSMFKSKRRRDPSENNHPATVIANQNVAAPSRRHAPAVTVQPDIVLQNPQHQQYPHPSTNNSAQIWPQVDSGYGYPPGVMPIRSDAHVTQVHPSYKSNMVAERKLPFVRDPLTLSVDFMVRFVGMVATAQGLQHSQEDHLDLIQALDQAQMDGQFKFAESDQDFVTLNLSKYGMKILEKAAQDRYPPGIRPPQMVRWRHGLVEIIRAVHYEDSLGRQLMAVKLGQEGEEIYDCLLFECDNQRQATQICKCLELLFNAVCQFTPL